MSYLMARLPMLRYHLMLALLIACLPTAALALGFGALNLSSHLNQAFSADVPLILNSSDDIDSVRVALASRHEYRQLGLQWQADLAHITVTLQAKHASRPFVALRSVGSIHTPILSVLLKAGKTGRGTYYKHFQVLLDPVESPVLRPQQPVVMALHPRSSESISPTPDTGWARIWRYGPVRTGDSLSEIAYRLRRDQRYSNRQVMLSLYDTNTQAFVGGNINLLKQGAWLTVPPAAVVQQYAGPASMHKLSQLLARTNAAGQTLHPVAKPKTKPAAKSEAPSTAPVSSGQPVLRYSGNISVSAITPDQLAGELNSVKNGFNQQFEAMHAAIMGGKLQMADLGKSVTSLNQSVQVIQQDIHKLKTDVAIIKRRTEHPVSESFSNWQLALFALLAAVFGALITLLFRKKPTVATEEPAVISPVAPTPQDTDNNATTASTLIADEAIQLLNRAEESLARCDYEQSEKILRQIDTLTPDSVRASALKAQLLHETDRHEERNELINSISEASDKQRWERFCQLLPSHVWNACFCDEAAHDTPPATGAPS